MNWNGIKSKRLPAGCYALAGLVLAAEAVFVYTLPAPPNTPLKQPLTSLPAQLGGWTAVRETPITSDVADVLKADETLNRDYYNASRGSSANLFIAYFGSQQQGRWVHSPQHCLPGAGWDPRSVDTVAVPVASEPRPIRVCRYILARGTEQAVVYYWFASNHRVIATEYLFKVYLVLDSIRYRRSNAALVRVTVQSADAAAIDSAIGEGVRFVQSCFQPVQDLVN